jgi:hypothetical protein
MHGENLLHLQNLTKFFLQDDLCESEDNDENYNYNELFFPHSEEEIDGKEVSDLYKGAEEIG